LRFPFWPVRLGGYAVMGMALHALGILMHEVVHGNFFRHHVLDRWSAFLLGVPVLVSGAAYKVTHLLHHRYNRGSQDPEYTYRSTRCGRARRAKEKEAAQEGECLKKKPDRRAQIEESFGR